MHSLDTSLPYAHNVVPPKDAASAPSIGEKFALAMAGAQRAVALRLYRGPFWPMWELFEDKTSAQMRTVNVFLDPIIDEALAKQKARGGEGKQEAPDEEEEVVLLDYLVRNTTGEWMPFEILGGSGSTFISFR